MGIHSARGRHLHDAVSKKKGAEASANYKLGACAALMLAWDSTPPTIKSTGPALANAKVRALLLNVCFLVSLLLQWVSVCPWIAAPKHCSCCVAHADLALLQLFED